MKQKEFDALLARFEALFGKKSPKEILRNLHESTELFKQAIERKMLYEKEPFKDMDTVEGARTDPLRTAGFGLMGAIDSFMFVARVPREELKRTVDQGMREFIERHEASRG